MENKKERRTIDKKILKATWKKTSDHVQMIRTQKESDFSTETGVRRQ